MAGKIVRKLTDEWLRVVSTYGSDPVDGSFSLPVVFWDTQVKGLRIRVGRHKSIWTFFQQHRRNGHRETTCRRLGFWVPVANEGMSVPVARKAALKIAGLAADGRIEPRAKKALTFTEAFDDYLAYLLRKVEDRNRVARECDANAPQKAATWHRNVTNLGKLYLKPKWSGYTLAEISRDPTGVRDWHLDVSRKAGAVTGNKCAKVLRATYRHAAKLRRDLPAELPTTGVQMNEEAPRDVSMTDKQFREWVKAWRKIESPVHRAYHLLACLTGQRPGELARVRLADVTDGAFTIGAPKAGVEKIWIPASTAIKRVLAMAVKARNGNPSEWLFPAGKSATAAGHLVKYDEDNLPVWGNGLRHNYKTVASTMKPPVPEMLVEFLQGHTPKGIARKYVSAMVLAERAALREAQEAISERIVGLLGLTDADTAAPSTAR